MKDYNEMSRSCPSGSFSYTIKAGDTLYQLARTYNTTVEAILAINPGINPNNLQIGQRICIPKSTPTPSCPSGSFAYTIKKGDTLWQLAKTYNTTVEAIMAINPGIDPNNLQIGQVICIPSSTPTRCPLGSFAYTIKKGDTLWQLARTYNTTVEAIMAINPGIDPNNLQIGQIICIPSSTPTRCPSGSFAYTIKKGDTLWQLARTYNTTVEAIMAINPGIDPNNLQIGQVICIPSSTPTPSCPSGSFAYTIKQGDTLYQLAITYNTTVGAIIAINPGIDPNNLQIGQVICIPKGVTPPPRCPSGSFAYTIRPGDTLFQLAMTFNTTVEAIIAINPGIDPNNLRVGEVICIPISTPTRCPLGSFAYTIRPGDTLFQLAMTFNTTVEAIIAINQGIDPNNLQIGQVICIPKGVTPPPTCPMGSFAYTIRPGDTLFQLAMTFNTTVEAIIAINPGIDPNNLRVGQVICIPSTTPTRCPSGSFAYTIRPGDTLFQLARTFNTTVEAIIAINPGIDPNNLRVGQVICIPRSTPPTCDGLYYVVRPGDTLFSIAMMYNVTVAELMAANPGIDPNNLMVGQLICIPKGGHPKPCPGGSIYVVRENDSLSTILLRFNISVMDLMAGNPNLDLDRIRVGQELCILPHKDRGCPCKKGTEPYVIKPADIPNEGPVVAALAMKFNTTVSYLMQANPNMAPGDFKAGVQICVPMN